MSERGAGVGPPIFECTPVRRQSSPPAMSGRRTFSFLVWLFGGDEDSRSSKRAEIEESLREFEDYVEPSVRRRLAQRTADAVARLCGRERQPPRGRPRGGP